MGQTLRQRCGLSLGVGLGLALWATLSAAQTGIGQALYDRGDGAAARLRGDAMVLPVDAARCANCHEPSRRPAQTDAAFGPRLDGLLTQPLPRRGGPPAAYDQAGFCKLLRTGIDPAQILVRRAMPVYDISDGSCAELWQAVSRREPLAQGQP